MTNAFPPPPPFTPPPPVPPAVSGSRNGFGTTALVLGIVGFLFALVPLVGVIAWPLVILGLVFAVLGWQRISKGEANNRGAVITGAITALLGLLVCVVYAVSFAKAVSDPMKSMTGGANLLGAPPAADGATITDGPANVPALPQPEQASKSSLPVAQLGQSINYPDGLSVSIGQAQRHRTGQYAAPTQFRSSNVLLLTVTVTNNSGQPISVNPVISGPKVTHGGQQAEQVYDNGFLHPNAVNVLPGKSYTYRYLYGAGAGTAEIQAEWTRDYGQDPAIFTGQG